MADRTVSVRYTADTSDFVTKVAAMASKAEKSARDLSRAQAEAATAAQKAEEAQKELTEAQSKAATAADKITAAEKKLDSARAKSNRAADKLKDAEAGAAKARADTLSATDKVSAAEKDLDGVRNKAGASADEVTAAEKKLTNAKADMERTTAEQVTAEGKLETARAEQLQSTGKLENAEKGLAEAADKNTAAQKDLSTASIKAARNADKLGVSVEGAGESALGAGRNTETFGKKTDEAFRNIDKNSASIDQLANTAGGLGVALAVPVGLAVKAFADFDQQMSAVSATGEDARANIDGLREAAIEAGADTAFSAKEAAEGVEELLKAGVSAADVMGGGLAGALDLAAAGQISVADAAETAATAMTQFKLSGRDVPRIADLLAAGAGKAQGEVGDLGEALAQGGLVASQFGLSIEETVGGLSAFAANGLLGSDAGTSFKQMLLSLANPSGKAAQAMADLGIVTHDANGEFIGIERLAGVLQSRMGELDDATRQQALAQIFGSDAIRAASILYDEGAEGIAKWTDEVNDAGFAAQTAAEKQNNLAGDIEKLGGSLDTVFLKSGTGANKVLRDLTQGAEDLVDGIGKLPPELLSAGLGITALTSGALLLGSGLAKGIVTVAEARTAYLEFAQAMPGVDSKLRGVAKAVGVASVALIGLQTAGMAAQRQIDDLEPSIEDVYSSLKLLADGSSLGTERLNEQFTGIVQGIDDMSDAFGELNSFSPGRGFFDFTSFVSGTEGPTALLTGRLKELDAALTDISESDPQQAVLAFQKIAEQADAAGVPIEKMTDEYFPEYRRSLEEIADTLGVTGLTQQEYYEWMQGRPPEAVQRLANKSDELSEAQKRLAGQMTDVNAVLEQQALKMERENNAAINLTDATIAYERALSDANETIKENGENTDLSTAAGQENAEALVGMAERSKALAQAMSDAGESTDNITAKMISAREEFIAAAVDAGYTEKAAEKLADKYGLFPEQITTAVTLETEAAEDELMSLMEQYALLPKHIQTEIEARANAANLSVEEYLENVGQIPEDLLTRVEAETGDAKQKLEDYNRIVDAANKVVKTKMEAQTGEAQQATQTRMQQYEQLPEEEKTEIIARANDADLTISEYLEKLKGIPADQPTDIVLRGVPEAKESVWDWVKNLFGARDSTQTAATGMTNALTGSLTTTSGAFASRGDQIGASWAGDMRYVRDQTDSNMTSARNTNSDRLESMSGKFDSSGRGIRDSWASDMKSVADTTWSRTESARNAIRDRMSQMSDKTDSAGRSMRDSWSDDLRSMQDRTWDRTASARDAIRDRMNQMSGKTDSAGRSMRQGWSSDLADMRNNTSRYARNMEDRIDAMARRVVGSARGIRGAMRAVGGTYNNIAEVANTRKVRLATGGIMPGYTPGRDVHRFFSPTGGTLELSGGEPVLRPEAGVALGHDWVHGINAAARQGGIEGARRFEKAWRARKGGGQAFSTGGIVGGHQAFASGGFTAFKGKRFTARFAQVLAMAERMAGTNMNISQGGWRPATSYSGTSHAGDAVDITRSNFAPLINALRSLGVAAWLRTPSQGNWPYHIHAIPGPSAGRAGGSGVSQWYSYVNGGNGLGGRDDWNFKGPKGGGSFNFGNLPSVGDIGKLMEWSMNGVRKEFDGDIAKIKDLPSGSLFNLAGKKLAESLIDGLIDRAEDGLKEVMPGFAAGGRVWGAGTATSDDILAKLSNGEYVMPTETVNYYGQPAMDSIRDMKIDREVLMPHMARGGVIERNWMQDQTRHYIQPATQDSPTRQANPPAQLHITNYYPQAEPTSVTINRAQQKQMLLGV